MNRLIQLQMEGRSAEVISKVDVVGIPSTDAERAKRSTSRRSASGRTSGPSTSSGPGDTCFPGSGSRGIGQSSSRSRTGSCSSTWTTLRLHAPSSRRRASHSRATSSTPVCHMATFADPDGNQSSCTTGTRRTATTRTLIQVERVDYSVSVLTRDIERAKQFYAEMLGLEARSPRDDMGEYEAGQVTLDVFDPSSIGQSSRLLRRDGPARRRRRRARAELEAKGVVFDGETHDERLQAGVVQRSRRQRAHAPTGGSKRDRDREGRLHRHPGRGERDRRRAAFGETLSFWERNPRSNER